MAFFDSYKNIDRGGITKESKTATKDALLTAYNNPKCKPHAIQIVKALLDFKAHQANDSSAERLLGNLANHIRVCNQAKGLGVPELTERSLHELVKNRSAIFKKDLPETFKDLLKQMMFQNDAKAVLIDTNTARILRSNGLITEADARAARPARGVAEQVLPGELAAFFTRSTALCRQQRDPSGSWSLAGFLHQCCKDYPRAIPEPTDAEWKALAHLVSEVSNGRLGSRKILEYQRQATEVIGKPAPFKRKITSDNYKPNKQSAVPNADTVEKGGHDRNYREFLFEAKKIPQLRQQNDRGEAFEKLLAREQALANAPRLSQHLPGDLVWRSQGQWEGASNPQHQQWLELHKIVRADISNRRQYPYFEDRETTRAILICAGRHQDVEQLLLFLRSDVLAGKSQLAGTEADLLARVAACLGPCLNGDVVPEASAKTLLCMFKLNGFRDGSLPAAFGDQIKGYSFPTRFVPTAVNVAARTVSHTLVTHIHIPGCQPVEDFYLYQTRATRFWWDEQTNFITAKVIDHSDWMCSTSDPQPVAVV